MRLPHLSTIAPSLRAQLRRAALGLALAGVLTGPAAACSQGVERHVSPPPQPSHRATRKAPERCEGIVDAQQHCPADSPCPDLLLSKGCGDILAATEHWILSGDDQRSFMHYRGSDPHRRRVGVRSLYAHPAQGFQLAQGGKDLWAAADGGLVGSFTHGLLGQRSQLKNATVAGMDFVTVPYGNTLQKSRFRILWQHLDRVTLQEIPSNYGPREIAQCEHVLGTSLTPWGALVLCRQDGMMQLAGDISSKPFAPLRLRDFRAAGMVTFQTPYAEPKDDGLWRQLDTVHRATLRWSLATARASELGLTDVRMLVTPHLRRNCNAAPSCPMEVRHLAAARPLWARGDHFVVYEMRQGLVGDAGNWQSTFHVARVDGQPMQLQDRASWQLPRGERCTLGQVSLERESGVLRIPCGQRLWTMRAFQLPPFKHPEPAPPPPPPDAPELARCGANPDVLFCDGRCIDTRVSRQHCGDCGTSCGAHMACIEGECLGAVCTDQGSCPRDWVCGDGGDAHAPKRSCRESNNCRHGERCVFRAGHGRCETIRRCQP